MKVNRHGIKMLNLRKVSGQTVDNPIGYSQISYDTATGELFEDWHYGDSLTSWTQYRDPDVIHVCNTRKHLTMQQIADAVRDRLDEEKRISDYIAG